ncbi:hypothetical protein AAC387_Pa05g0155 [Persea americana]
MTCVLEQLEFQKQQTGARLIVELNQSQFVLWSPLRFRLLPVVIFILFPAVSYPLDCILICLENASKNKKKSTPGIAL